MKVKRTEALSILQNPKLNINDKEFWAVPMQSDENYVFFNLIPYSKENLPPFLKRWVTSLRAISLTVMLLPTLTILILGLKQGLKLNPYNAIAGMIIPCLLLLSVNLLNDIEDHLRLIDLPGTNGGSGVIQKGWISPKELKIFAFILFLLAFLISIPILFLNPTLLIFSLILTTISVIGYSNRPFNFKYNGLGDLVVFLTCGPFLTSVYSLTTFQDISIESIAFGSFYGLLAVTILHANNLNDINIDQKSGAQTIASYIGFRASKIYMGILYLSILLILVYLIPQIASWGLLAFFIPGFLIIKLMVTISKSQTPDDEKLQNIRFSTPQIHLLTGIILCLNLLISFSDIFQFFK